MERVGQILVKSFSGSVPRELFTRIIRGAFCKTSKIEFKRALKESETVVLWATSYRDIVVYESAVISFDDGEEIEGRFFCVECSEFLEFLGEKGYILYQVIPKEEDKVSG